MVSLQFVHFVLPCFQLTPTPGLYDLTRALIRRLEHASSFLITYFLPFSLKLQLTLTHNRAKSFLKMLQRMLIKPILQVFTQQAINCTMTSSKIHKRSNFQRENWEYWVDCRQRDRTRRASLRYQHFNFLSYLGRSGSFLQSRIYIMKVVQYPWNEKNILPPMGFEPQSPSMWTWNTTLRPTSKLYPLQDIYMYLDLKRVIKLPKESLRVFSLWVRIKWSTKENTLSQQSFILLRQKS